MTNNKIGALAMITALLGGTAGALVTRTSTTNSKALPANAQVAAPLAESTPQVAVQPQPVTNTEFEAPTSAGDKIYRDGFAEGFQAAREESQNAAETQAVTPERVAAAPSPVAYRSSRPRYSNAPQSYQSQDSYRPAKRSFWSKHRDKLTVAAGAGGGAVIGGLIGGKKGAAIGALAGGGGSALYTYKLRKKAPRN